MVADGAFIHKMDYVTIFKEILNLEGQPSHITGSRVMGQGGEFTPDGISRNN